jgi:hypothetical protein
MISLLEDGLFHAWAVAKSLQTQVNILETAMIEIATTEEPDTNDSEHDCVAVAQGALRKLKEHRES